jgi:hypothetical protein
MQKVVDRTGTPPLAPKMNVTGTKHTPSEALARLAEFFRRNGYVRLPSRDRRAAEGHQYKKGYEARFVANSAAELQAIRRLLKAAGFSVANPFTHCKQWRQPLYGREAVERFLNAIGWTPDGQPDGPTTGPAAQ